MEAEILDTPGLQDGSILSLIIIIIAIAIN